ncbi:MULTISPECIES: hypothetical protein [Amycolatopsis]|uniref:Transposase n=1 Tax=Amycolatopsis bullii TaxID=941987 RepID=A0ABQ3K0L7_9PSEU|nr:hypothetical protein [Amycolatopsis bullii]GHF98347.1 hypothetical protein GCM10017567_11290 [Amycolatopsis bullii]
MLALGLDLILFGLGLMFAKTWHGPIVCKDEPRCRPFRLLGSSVNGVGRNITAIMKSDPEVARVYHHRYEALWSAASVVKPQAPARGSSAAQPASNP